MLVIIAPTARDHLRGSEGDPRQEIGTEVEFGHFDLQAPWRGHPKVNHPLRVGKKKDWDNVMLILKPTVMDFDLSWLFSFPSCPEGPLVGIILCMSICPSPIVGGLID